MHDDLLNLLPVRRGHFALESGHHGNLWLDLERLFLVPERVRPYATELAARLRVHDVQAVCGPLVEGAFVGLMVASVLGVPFTYSERITREPSTKTLATDGLYPFAYRVPTVLRIELRGKRVAIVNDVINAGSAVRGTFDDLLACGAEPVAIGTLAVLGDWAATFVRENGLRIEVLASIPNPIWAPHECPLCAKALPLDR